MCSGNYNNYYSSVPLLKSCFRLEYQSKGWEYAFSWFFGFFLFVCLFVLFCFVFWLYCL